MDTLYPSDLKRYSRREFIRLAAQSLAGFFALPLLEAPIPQTAFLDPTQERQGRILNNQASLYASPSFSSTFIKVFHFDRIVPITAITIGDQEPAYNRIWYQINNEGWVHSGSVQPVEISPVSPLRKIPEKGFLGEICVPYTDAVWHYRRPTAIAYRFYYSTTHWVTGVSVDSRDQVWYHVPDDKWGYTYYVDARHLRPLSAEQLSPLSPHVPPEEKRIEIHLDEQVLIAYEGGKAVFMSRTATGARFRDGDFTTRKGRYITNRKRPSRHMAAGDAAAPNSYDLPGVPWVSYLTKSGVAIHGTFWHNDFGKPRSHGCINVSSRASHWIYRWTMPEVPKSEQTWTAEDGTAVDVMD